MGSIWVVKNSRVCTFGTDAQVEVIRSVGLRIGGSRDSATITSDALKAASSLPYHGPADVVFRLTRVPHVGNIFRSDQPAGYSVRYST